LEPYRVGGLDSDLFFIFIFNIILKHEPYKGGGTKILYKLSIRFILSHQLANTSFFPTLLTLPCELS